MTGTTSKSFWSPGLGSLLLSFAIFSAFRFSLGIGIPRIKDEFTLDPVETGSIFSSNMLSQAIGMILSGSVLQRFGSKTLALCNLIQGISLLLLGYSFSYYSILISTLAAGFGSGILIPLVYSFEGELTSSRKGLMLGLIGGLYGLGGAVGPPIGGLIIRDYGWRPLFLAYGTMGILASVLISMIRKDNDSKPVRQDSRRISLPNLIKNTRVLRSCTALFVTGLSYSAILSWSPVFLSSFRDLDPAAIGTLFGLFSVSTIAGSLTFGSLADRIENRTLAVIAALTAAAVGALYPLIPYPFPILALMFLVLGFTLLPIWNLHTYMAQSYIVGRESVAVTGLLHNSSTVGSIISPMLIGSVLGFASLDLTLAACSSVPLVVSSIITAKIGSPRKNSKLG